MLFLWYQNGNLLRNYVKINILLLMGHVLSFSLCALCFCFPLSSVLIFLSYCTTTMIRVAPHPTPINHQVPPCTWFARNKGIVYSKIYKKRQMWFKRYESRQTSQLLFCKFSPFSDMKADIVYHWLSIYDNWDDKSLTRNFSLGITLVFLIVRGVYFPELGYFTTDIILSCPPPPILWK